MHRWFTYKCLNSLESSLNLFLFCVEGEQLRGELVAQFLMTVVAVFGETGWLSRITVVF